MSEVTDEEIDKNVEYAKRWNLPIGEVLHLLKDERTLLYGEISRLNIALDLMEEHRDWTRDEAYRAAGP